MLKIGFWFRVWNIELTLIPVYKLSRVNIEPENICDTVFEKAHGHAGKANRTSVYGEAAVQKGSLKKVLWEISENSTIQKYILFLEK